MNTFSKLTAFFFVSLVVIAASPCASAGEFTDVIDAFDKDNGDPFDLNLRIGYQRFQETGDITRETLSPDPQFQHSLDYYPKYKFGTYKHTQNILDLALDIGLFRDVSFRFGLPIILSDDRSITKKLGWAPRTESPVSQDVLFGASVRSPQRSGVDYLSAALWWAIFDQSRTKEYPTITAFIEGRFAVGKKLTAACVKGDSPNLCDNTKSGGISNNVNQLRMGLHFSRRYDFLEPFMGIDGMVGFYKGKDITMGGGALNDMPPIKGTFDFGMELVPWEVPDEHRKFFIVIGGGAIYHSEGRTYTPLFDALGTSSYFTDPTTGSADIDNNGTTDHTPGGSEQEALSAWNGMTDIENFAEFFGRLDIAIQPAKYVKFNLGFKAGHKSEHFITKTDQCTAGSVSSTGVCSFYNPGHRPQIDEPGTRFRSEKTFVWSLFLDATAQF